jgi:hypothetical protein
MLLALPAIANDPASGDTRGGRPSLRMWSMMRAASASLMLSPSDASAPLCPLSVLADGGSPSVRSGTRVPAAERAKSPVSSLIRPSGHVLKRPQQLHKRSGIAESTMRTIQSLQLLCKGLTEMQRHYPLEVVDKRRRHRRPLRLEQAKEPMLVLDMSIGCERNIGPSLTQPSTDLASRHAVAAELRLRNPMKRLGRTIPGLQRPLGFGLDEHASRLATIKRAPADFNRKTAGAKPRGLDVDDHKRPMAFHRNARRLSENVRYHAFRANMKCGLK